MQFGVVFSSSATCPAIQAAAPSKGGANHETAFDTTDVSSPGGCLIVGTEGMLRATEHNSRIFLYPGSKFADFQGPPETLPRSGSHEREWIAACKGGPAAMSNFDYSGPLVEFLMRGNVATQCEGPREFDPLACGIIDNAEADALLRRQYRQGWTL